jgi:TPR repeat protein
MQDLDNTIKISMSETKLKLGLYYMKVKDYNKMKEHYMSAIEDGNVLAMFNLGLYYDSIEKNHDCMRKYYMMAADKGDIDAICNLGVYYRDNNNYTEMEKYFLMAANSGDTNSMCELGEYYRENEKYTEMKKYFLMAANSGDTNAMCSLGEYYYDIANYIDSYKFYSMAANKGDKHAITQLEKECFKKCSPAENDTSEDSDSSDSDSSDSSDSNESDSDRSNIATRVNGGLYHGNRQLKRHKWTARELQEICINYITNKNKADIYKQLAHIKKSAIEIKLRQTINLDKGDIHDKIGKASNMHTQIWKEVKRMHKNKPEDIIEVYTVPEIIFDYCHRCLDKYIKSSRVINCEHKDICKYCTEIINECQICNAKYE